MTATVQQIIERAPHLPQQKAERVLQFMIKVENEPDVEDKARLAKLEKIRQTGGMLHKYADLSKIPLEEGAFERAVVENYVAD